MFVVATGLGLAATSDALAQVKLQYKFPEGRKLTYESSSKTSQVLTIMGQAIETESKESSITSRQVGKKRDDGTVPVVEKVESFAVELALPGGINISYDSKDPNAKIDNPQLAFLDEVFKIIGQLSYTVVLDDQNKVKAIEGTEKLLEQAEKLSDQGKSAIRGRLKSEHLKTQFEQALGNVPDILARPGEPWERTETLDIGSGQSLTFHKKYEYQGTEKRGASTLDKISVKSIDVKYQMDPDSPLPLKATKSDLKIESGDGAILFDREQGNIVSATGKTRIKGDMTFTANGQELPSTLDLTIESSSELKPSK
jgi:hypothetical protein